jgi:diguanylate cyclase (GGDEF)-like protein
MKKTTKGKSLYSKLLWMTLLPILLLTLVITSFSVRSFATSLDSEVKTGLTDLSATIMTLYDMLYPGDYQIVEQDGAIYMLKGEHQMNGDFSIIDEIKEETGVEITVLYQDTRVITTLFNQEGERMIGTKVNAVVVNDVLESGQAAFYPSVAIGKEEYFAYYAPLINDDGTCVGMLFVAKPAERVRANLRKAIMPIIVLGIAVMIIAAMITLHFSTNLMNTICKIEAFLGKVAKGELNESLDYQVSKREDELGELGRNAVRMQKSLSELVEKDALTGLLNRRSGDKKLHQAYKDKEDKNQDFCIALGDVDLFKKVNDTYGHEWGDVVLMKLSRIMKQNMQGRGAAIRWGGEEFLLVFTNMDLKETYERMSSIMDEIRELEIVCGENEKIHVTMTFGICQGGADNVDGLLREADSKLYYGKNNGRNQLVK